MAVRFSSDSGESRNLVLAAIAIIVVCVVVVYGVMYWRADSTGVEHEQVWYYDLNTQELFAADRTLVPPIEAPSGPAEDGGLAGVRAYVFSCGDCSDSSERFVGWVEKYTADVRRAIRVQTGIASEEEMSGPTLPPPRWEEGHLIRAVENTETGWVQASSGAGQAIKDQAMQRCESGQPTPCFP